ncbi:glycosyltransferase [Candidatus Falkowbacteria bacterium]|nr:glycosyltransferase [Candidatus Falkowbacteria bacterium]
MKIVQVNKFLYPKGGADRYCLSLIKELSNLGETVIPFGMADARNLKSPWEKYFTEAIDYYGSANKFKIAKNLIWNREAAQKFGALLDETKPELVHAHNIYHQLSPAILPEAKKRGIKVIMTLHDYKLVCPNYRLFTKGHHCEACLGGAYYNCLKNNCYESYPRSALAALESFLHNKKWQTYYKNIDLLISPSEYLKNKLVKAGWPANLIKVLINPAPPYNPQPDGERLLYLGRLTKEKGVEVLLRALKGTNEYLDIAGTGPEEENLKQLVKELGLVEQVIFHGHLDGESLEKLKKEAKAIILPSVWAENMSLVLLEALAYQKLIIASETGGSPEIIKDGQTGWLFPAGDVAALRKCLIEVNNLSPTDRALRGEKIKDLVVPLSLEKHLEKLQQYYQEVLRP